MSISRQNLSVVIVTLKSENVIHECIKSINQNIPIIVVENSNNINFKRKIEKSYRNIKCYLTGSNIGYARANNIGLRKVKTKFALVINPDVIISSKQVKQIENIAKQTMQCFLSSKTNTLLFRSYYSTVVLNRFALRTYHVNTTS